jgi:hypothetical protein
LHHLSNAELGVTYLMKGRLRVIVSTFQMGVLVHYDTAAVSACSYGDLRAATLLDEAVRDACVLLRFTLVCARRR